jgi:hypothetical protein
MRKIKLTPDQREFLSVGNFKRTASHEVYYLPYFFTREIADKDELEFEVYSPEDIPPWIRQEMLAEREKLPNREEFSQRLIVDDLYSKYNTVVNGERVYSTLEGFTGYVSGRRVGNTTRLVDHAVQMIFSNKAIIAHDHYLHGTDREANRHLFRKIMERLVQEHNFQALKNEKNIYVDYDKFIIKMPRG